MRVWYPLPCLWNHSMTSRSNRIDTAFFGSGRTIFARRNQAASAIGDASGSEARALRIVSSSSVARRLQSVCFLGLLLEVDGPVIRFLPVTRPFSGTDDSSL